MNIKFDKINGLIAAPYTPFDKKGNLNTGIIQDYAQYLKLSGVRGVFVNGTTGEGLSLTAQERMTCAEEWIRYLDAGFIIIAHVGHNSLTDCKLLAAHAQECGASAIGLLAPNFFKPQDLEALVSFNAMVAEAAPDLPFYYYHMPAMTGVNFQMSDFLQIAEGQIPNLVGLKFTHEDLMDMRLCLEYSDSRYDILHGRDEILTCGLILGATGAIGSTYNYIAPLFNRIIDAYKKSDLILADKLQLEAIHIIEILKKYGGAVKAGKSIMRLVGFDFGQPRAPVVGLTSNEEKQLHHELLDENFRAYSLPAASVL